MESVTLYANQSIKLQNNSGAVGVTGEQIVSGYCTRFNHDIKNVNYTALQAFDKNQMPQGAIIDSADFSFYSWLHLDNPSAELDEYYNRVYTLDSGGFSESTATWQNTINRGISAVAEITPYTTQIPDEYVWNTVPVALYSTSEKATFVKKLIQSGFVVLPTVLTWTTTFEYASGTFHLHTANSPNKPKLVVYYTSPIVRVTPNIQSGTTIYRNAGKTVSWSFGWQSDAKMYGVPQQTRADIKCESGGQTKTITVYGNGTSAVIPAGTFTQATGRIQITVTSTAGGTATSQWIDVNTPEVGVVVTPSISDGFFIPKNEPKSISWSLAWNPSDVISGNPQQRSATVACKDGQTTKNINVSNGALTAIIPAGTFTQDSGQIQITVNTEKSSPSTTKWITVNTVDQPGTAVAVKPRGEKINGDADNIFYWEYNNPAGTSQTKAELQISYNDGGKWEALATVTTPIKWTTIPAGKLMPGSCSWRVRCYNSDGVAGEYSEPAYLIVEAKPKTPSYVVTDAKPLLTVNWASVNQQGYQLQVTRQSKVVYDSGIVFGVVTKHKVPVLLEDGAYQIMVRIIDIQGAWSDWKSTSANIHNTTGKAISVDLKSVWYGVRLAWETSQVYSAYYILRDGIPVAKTIEKTWTDWETAGRHKYTVRGIQNGYYTDSKSLIGIPAIRYAGICEKGKNDWVLLKYHEGSPFTHEESNASEIEYVYYAGRSLPVPYPLGQKAVTHSLEFTVKNQEEWQKIKSLVGKMVVYKDYRGNLITGMLDDISVSHTKRITFSLQITEVDKQEAILYES